MAKYPLCRGFSCGSNITQETREVGEKPLAFILILIPSVGPHSEEIITLDSAYTLVIGKYKNEKEETIVVKKIIIPSSNNLISY